MSTSDAPPGSKEMRRTLLQRMLRLRLIEEGIAARYSEWKMRCPTHLSVGQEATAVGMCAALLPRDYAMSTHRAHAHYLAKGGALRPMIAELYGKEGGCARGRGGSMHLIDRNAGFLGAVPVVGSTIPIAVGAAWGSQRQKEDRVTLGFFGDGATEEGVFSESLNFAALHKIPIVFACENNFYSVYSNLESRQAPGRNLKQLVEGHGGTYFEGDGQDVEDVKAVTQQAVDRARQGEGPSLVYFETYRWREHCGPFYDDELGYRPEGELASWKERCPVQALRGKMLAASEITEEEWTAWSQTIEEEIQDAFEFAEASPFPSPHDLEDTTFATPLEKGGSR